MPTEYQPLNIPALFMAAQQMRLGRQQEQQNQLQLSALGRQEARQAEIDAALRAGDMKRWAQLDPTGAAKYQQTQLEGLKTRADLVKTQGETVDAQQKRDENAQKFVLAQLARDPTRLGDAMALRDRYVKEQGITHFTLPGEGRTDTAPDGGWVQSAPTQQEVFGAQKAAGVDPLAGLDGDVKEYVQVTGDMPGSPGFRQRYDARKLEFKKAGRSQINIGGKTLAASNVNELSDLDTAMGSVDALLASYKKDVGSDDTIRQLISRGEKYVPNSIVAQYQNDADVTAQVVGLILENGKLGEADLPRYKAMMPQPGDSVETADRKAATIKALLRRKLAGRKSTLGKAGYRVPGVSGGASGVDQETIDLFNNTSVE